MSDDFLLLFILFFYCLSSFAYYLLLTDAQAFGVPAYFSHRLKKFSIKITVITLREVFLCLILLHFLVSKDSYVPLFVCLPFLIAWQIFAYLFVNALSLKTRQMLIPYALKIIYPISRLVYPLVERMIKVFPRLRHIHKSPQVKEEDIERMVEAGEKAGVIKDLKKDVLSGLFDSDEKLVREIMTPRTEVISLALDAKVNDAVKLAVDSNHSRFPVYDEEKTKIVGLVLFKDLLAHARKCQSTQKDFTLHEIMRKPIFVPESILVFDLFKQLQDAKTHMAMVVDEYGVFCGVVTLEDVLEELVGEIEDEFDVDESKIKKVAPNLFECRGSLSIEEWTEFFKFDEEKVREAAGESTIDTMSGWLMSHFQGIPKVGQSTVFDSWKIEVTHVHHRRVERFLMQKNI